MGNDNANSVTVTIAPGTKIMGQQAAEFMYIERGSKIVAIGTPQSPFIFTDALKQTPG